MLKEYHHTVKEAAAILFVVLLTAAAGTRGVALGADAADVKEAGGEGKCKEGVLTSTGYPYGLLYRKLGFENLYKEVKPEEGKESDALKEVRELEELLFPPSPGVDKMAKILNVISSIFSDVQTQDPAGVSDDDLAWVKGLAMPDLPIRYHPKVITFLKSFKNEKRWKNILRGWLAKKERYGPIIREELGCRGLPRDIQYLAMIESGYDPTVASKAGAAGLWQFMPVTGNSYGLVQTTWMDQRRNPELSTVSAITHLEDLKAVLGSWYLAFAAYNAGYGNILNAIKKFNTNDFWRLIDIEGALPWETTNYVPKLVAVAVAAGNPKEFGLDGITEADPISYNVVQIPIPVNFSLIAKAAGVNEKEIEKINPELEKSRVPPDVVPYPVRLPDTVDVDKFEKKFKKFRQGYKPLVQYKVKFGDTISRIAQMSKTTAKEIRDLNGLGKNDRIFAGSHLIVPKPIPKTKVAATAEKQIVVVPGRKFDSAGKKRIFYPIAAGDTLSEIALFFRAKLTDLCDWNDLDPQAVIVSDMVLQIYVDPDFDLSSANVLDESDVKVFEAGSDTHLDYLVEKEGRKRVEYTVSTGDKISTIAKKFKVKKYSLYSINKIGPGKALEAGDILILYVDPKIQKKYFPKKKKKAPMEPKNPQEKKEPPEPAKPKEPKEPEGSKKPGHQAQTKELKKKGEPLSGPSLEDAGNDPETAQKKEDREKETSDQKLPGKTAKDPAKSGPPPQMHEKKVPEEGQAPEPGSHAV